MNTVALGASSLLSSRLAYGCWRIAGTWEPAEVSPERETAGGRAVIAAYEAGYTLFDHADIYCHGVAETIFGKVLKEVSGMRERVLIASKCGIRKKGAPETFSAYRYDSSAAHIIASCESSLTRLGVEQIDLYQIHRPDFLMRPDEVAGAFEKLKQSGKVREFGVSNFNAFQVALLQKACPMPLVVNQIEISLAHLDPFHDGALDHCLAERITPMAWSPLGGGKIAATGPIDMHLPDHAKRQKLRDTLEHIAHARGVSRSVIAVAWLLHHPAGIIPIIGSTNPVHIKDAAIAAETELTRDEWYRLMEAAHGQRLA